MLYPLCFLSKDTTVTITHQDETVSTHLIKECIPIGELPIHVRACGYHFFITNEEENSSGVHTFHTNPRDCFITLTPQALKGYILFFDKF